MEGSTNTPSLQYINGSGSLNSTTTTTTTNTTNNNYSHLSHTWQTTAGYNTSVPDDCLQVVFSQMEYVPWDNPDNIVSRTVETAVLRIKNNLAVLLFLIGWPANILNMAVFYHQGLKDRVNVCLFALSLSDKLFLLTQMLLHIEQLVLQFTTQENFGPILTFLANNNFVIPLAFSYISPLLSAIIATERCLCVSNPLKFQHLLRTQTMAAIVSAIYVVIISLSFIVAFRYRVGCVYDPVSGKTLITAIEGELYRQHKDLVNHLDSFIMGVGVPGFVMVVVSVTTIITIVRLRQIARWRSEITSTISTREMIGLTKMLVGNSLLFIVCMFPIALIRFGWLFLPEMNAGKRNHNIYLVSNWTIQIFFMINATFNIVVYYAMGTRYRETFHALFKKSRGRLLQGSAEGIASGASADSQQQKGKQT